MQLEENVAKDCDDVEDFRSVLFSPTMYLYPNVYDKFCVGMESGRLRGMETRTSQSSLPDMISIAYEAHFRLEIYLACSEQGYRHSYSKEATQERSETFKQFLRVVKTDRINNADIAWTTRQDRLTQAGLLQATMVEDDAFEHGAVNFEDDAF